MIWSAVGVENVATGQVVWGADQIFVVPLPDFTIQAPTSRFRAARSDYVIQAGESTVVPLNLELSTNMAFSVEILPDMGRLPDGLYVDFSQDVFAVNVTSASSTVQISASETMPPGSYVVPIIVCSERLEHTLDLTIEVVQKSTEFTFYPPLLQR